MNECNFVCCRNHVSAFTYYSAVEQGTDNKHTFLSLNLTPFGPKTKIALLTKGIL